jgi:NaMN:DMB phosphoribosyltransferase
MDTGPLIKVFDSLLTAGAAIGLTATAVFVMLAGYQYMSAAAACARSSPPRAASTTP